MSLTAIEIAKVLGEITPVLSGGWIQKIYQPTARTLVFEIRVPGRTHRLLVSCQPETSRLHLIARPVSNPTSPPPFCQFLRAHCQGARLDGIEQVDQDRIIRLNLTTHNGPRTLICELTGRKADLLMLDSEGLVLRHLNKESALIGRSYSPPPKGDFGFKDRASSRVGPMSSKELPHSSAIEAFYRDREYTLAEETARSERGRWLKKAVRKGRRRIESWEEDLAKAAKYEAYGRYGELLKANLTSVSKGANHLVVIDYFDESMPEITIPLDQTKSVQSNMDDYFRKYKKYLTAERELHPRIEKAKYDLDTLRQELRTMESGTWTPSVAPIVHTDWHGAKPDQKRRDRSHRPFRRFLSADGLQILVGRNARENDELTFGLAKSDDLWLHARGTPGSHVVVRLNKGQDPPVATLREAATLALLYSDLKKSGRGEILYTRRKWVKKAKGQTAGAVIVAREQSLHVTLDKAMLALLKDRSRQESP